MPCVGGTVRLLVIEPWFFDGIEPTDCELLRSCVGRTTEIIGFDEHGHAEIEFVRTNDDDYRCHTLWVAQDWLEKV